MFRPLVTGRSAQSRRFALVLLLVLMLFTAACGGNTGSAGDTESGGTTAVKIGVIPIVDVAPIYLGVKQGFFTAEGLDVTLETAQGGAAIVPGVVSGQYQFGFSNSISLMLASSQGLPLKAVTSGVATTGEDGKDFGAVVVKSGSSIKTAADLAGKRVAVNTLKNINTTTINNAVQKAGGDPSTINYVELPFPDIVTAVAKGDVDAGQVVEPFLTIAGNQGGQQVVSNYAVTDPNLTVAMYFTSAQYASQNAAVVTKFSTAMNKSMEYAQAHPDEVRAALSTYTKIDAAVQENLILPKWPSAIDRDSIQLLADLATKDGLITKQPDLNALLPS
jgi:NitT/TauT family transport system substrate-binding protein